MAAPGQFHLFTNFEWENGDTNEYSLSPSIMVGLLPRVALGVETDFRDSAGDGWSYSSVTPMLHVQLTSPESDFPIRFGFSAGYTFADGSNGGHDHAEEADHNEEGDHHAEEGEEHDAGHHAEEEATHEHFHGVHQHGVDAFVGRLVAEADVSKSVKVVANLLSLVEDGGDAHWGYAAGVRAKVAAKVALGVEAVGDFDSEGWHEIVAATYVEPVEGITLKLGAGFGLTEETPDFTLRSGLIWRF